MATPQAQTKISVTAVLNGVSFISKFCFGFFFFYLFQLSVTQSQNSLLGIVHCG